MNKKVWSNFQFSKLILRILLGKTCRWNSLFLSACIKFCCMNQMDVLSTIYICVHSTFWDPIFILGNKKVLGLYFLPIETLNHVGWSSYKEFTHPKTSPPPGCWLWSGCLHVPSGQSKPKRSSSRPGSPRHACLTNILLYIMYNISYFYWFQRGIKCARVQTEYI